MSDDVLIAVDPHKASNTAAVLDPVSKTVIEAARFANTIDGSACRTNPGRRSDAARYRATSEQESQIWGWNRSSHRLCNTLHHAIRSGCTRGDDPR